MKRRVISIVAIALALVMFTIPMASAAVYSSDYISASNATISKVSSGVVRIRYNVYGKYGVNEAGAKKVVVYESSDESTWTPKKTFYSSTTSDMIAYGVMNTSLSVTYNGRAGYYYMAEVTVYAGTDGTGDTDIEITGSVKA